MIGRTLGPYRIVAEIGKGGMGVVYAAEHTVIGRSAVIKVLHPKYAQRPDIVQRLLNEARAPNAVGHPDLVEIYDVGTTCDGEVYLVMEHLQGISFYELLRDEGSLPESVVRAIGARIARALVAAHEKGIIHRDLKPKNIFLLPDANRPGETNVKVIDFGVAKLAGPEMEPGIETEAESMLGSPAYMSPEQCRGAGEVEPRSDIYSLGVVLYQALAGRLPFKAKSLGQLIELHLTAEPEPVSTYATSVSREMDVIVRRCLEKNPDRRFRDMEHLASVLEGKGRAAPTIQLQVAKPPELDRSLTPGSGVVPPVAGPLLGTGPTVTASTVAEPIQPEKTTLASSVGEASFDSTPDPPRGRWTPLVWIAVGIAVLLAGAVGYWRATTRGGEDGGGAAEDRGAGPSIGAQPGSDPGATGSAEPVVDDAPAGDAPAGDRRAVTVEIVTAPPGATVTDSESDVVIGRTPTVLSAGAEDSPKRVRVSMKGFDPEEIVIPTDGSAGTITVTLVPSEETVESGAGGKTESAKKKGAKKPGSKKRPKERFEVAD